MSRKHRAQHEAKRAQLDHYHAMDTGPAEGLDGIDDDDDDDDEDGDFEAQMWAQAPAAAGSEQRGAA